MLKKLTILSLAVMLVLTAGNVFATDWYVSNSGNNSNGGTSWADAWKDIQYAINNGSVSDGDIINVAAGTYDENLSIQKPVSLIGAGSAVTTITTTNSVEYLIFIGAISGMTFSQGMVIEGFTFTSSTLSGDMDYIGLRASGPSEGDPIIIRNNVFDCIDQDNSVKGIETASGTDLSNFVIEDNEFKNECRYCMWFNSAINGVIQGNTMTDAKFSALALCTSDLNQIHDVEILDNEIVRSTSFSDAGSNPGWAIWYSGMHIGSTCYNMNINGNIVKDGNYYGIVIHDRGSTDLTNFHINCNSIYNNGSGSLNEISTVTIDATKNWWGSATGPTHSSNSGGTGDAISDYFTYYPWLIDTDIENCDALIAVELNSFFAQVTAENVTLTWSTATETENLGFHVYRSIAEDGEFIQINREMILGAGSSDEAQSYVYIDKDVKAGNTYYYKLADVDFNGNMAFHGPISVTVEAATPSKYVLEQSYPNPFNPETAINFSIKQAGKVTLKIYNLQGQVVRTLVNEEKLVGSYSVMWNGTADNGTQLTSGVYYYTLKVNGFEETKKLTLMK